MAFYSLSGGCSKAILSSAFDLDLEWRGSLRGPDIDIAWQAADNRACQDSLSSGFFDNQNHRKGSLGVGCPPAGTVTAFTTGLGHSNNKEEPRVRAH
jgi:hypothetical protein